MALIDAGLRGALIALLALVVIALLPQRQRTRQTALASLAIALAASLIVQTLSASPWVEQQLSCQPQAPGIGISLGSAVLFWLFARAVFQDEFRLRLWHGLLWGAVVLWGATVCQWGAWGPGWVLMRAIPIGFALLGLAAVVGPWRVDLVDSRRQLRLVVVGGGAGYGLVQVGLRLTSSDGRLSELGALTDVALLLVLTAVIAGRLLAPRAQGLWAAERPLTPLPPTAPPVPPAPDPQHAQDQQLAAALADFMGRERGYAHDGLSLAGLAQQLAAPEYRLRRVINQHLGHRNFNAYVNGLRVAEAKRRLADPQQRGLPVLSIALDVGFGSIGPFNRAFKAETGLTPTEFRQQALAES
ncbi:AraC family transcriptional regulator [Roseateles paludis]|jgi:AraC-like DNA-binding protein|uniref:Helix-turn-helix domain-containing protein n=1 Tax=Roseateles paludis TaxID=3145238 RepID=A0ABV0G044_9BURK